MLDGVTLDQLRMLIAIADTGSFTAASKHVQRAQSAVSQSIATLEDQLGVTLFDRSTRRPRLTEAGEVIVAEARMVIVRAARLRATANALAGGAPGHLTIAIGIVVPVDPMVEVLDTFRDAFPGVSLRVLRVDIGGAPDLVSSGQADLGIAGAISLTGYDEDAFDRHAVGSADIAIVAAPDHPLVQLGRPLTDADVQDHRQLVPVTRGDFANRLVHDTWEVGDLTLRCRMLRRGLGWGTAPIAEIAEDLARGTLVPLQLEARSEETLRVPLLAFTRTDRATGPALDWLIRRLRDVFGDAGS